VHGNDLLVVFKAPGPVGVAQCFLPDMARVSVEQACEENFRDLLLGPFISHLFAEVFFFKKSEF